MKVRLIRNLKVSGKLYPAGLYEGTRAEVFIPELEAKSKYVEEIEAYKPPEAVVNQNMLDMSSGNVVIPGFAKLAEEPISPPAKKKITKRRAPSKRKAPAKRTTKKKTTDKK